MTPPDHPANIRCTPRSEFNSSNPVGFEVHMYEALSLCDCWLRPPENVGAMQPIIRATAPQHPSRALDLQHSTMHFKSAITPLESALTSHFAPEFDLKSFRMRTYVTQGGGGVSSPIISNQLILHDFLAYRQVLVPRPSPDFRNRNLALLRGFSRSSFPPSLPTSAFIRIHLCIRTYGASAASNPSQRELAANLRRETLTIC